MGRAHHKKKLKKKKKLRGITIIIILTAWIVVMVFNSAFAKATIDYFAFFAASFLIIDALYKITRKSEPFFPNQMIRFIRLIIGVCILTIHIMQVIYGV